MVQTEADYKFQIEDIFESAVDSCSFVREFALQVVFRDQTDVGNVFTKSRIPFVPFSDRLKNKDLYALSQEVPLVTFQNATINRSPTVRLTGRADEKEKRLNQDPFHIDELPFLGLFKDGYPPTTIIYSPEGVQRDVPTYYATYDSVQNALRELSLKASLPWSMRQALLAMSEDGYEFSALSRNSPERATLLSLGHDSLTHDIFASIDEDQKFEKDWNDDNRVVMHSNQPNTILHGRPSSQEGFINHLHAISFYPN